MNRALIALALGLSITTGCAATGKDINNHWSERSIAPRAARFFLGYDASKDGEYIDFQWRRKQDINLTLKRHFLNWNPTNPHHPEDPTAFQPRPIHSLLPNPVNYIHLEGILLGLGLWGAGTFFPLPLDSIIATLGPGGLEEFAEGVAITFTPLGVVVASASANWLSPGLEGIFGGESHSAYAHVVEVGE